MKIIQEATLGGGCFWCLEAVYQQLVGVISIESGYAGGHTLNPNYEEVCSGNTGHAEVVKISFDSKVVDYQTILKIFFSIHDPTTLNRQGNDLGTQYRSVIFVHNEKQKIEAMQVMNSFVDFYDQPIVTEIVDLPEFYKAEEYHQNYFLNHPAQGYCSFVVAPKLEKFKKEFATLLKKATHGDSL